MVFTAQNLGQLPDCRLYGQVVLPYHGATRESACSSDTLPSVSELNAGRQKLPSALLCSPPCWPICWSSCSSLLGIEHISIRPGITRVNALNLYDFAWSHSLVMDVVWGALLAAAYCLTRRYGRGAWVLFAAVLSHWVLDWASHRPDMPLAPGFQRYYGLGLYNSPLGLLIVEGGLWVIGIIL